MATTAQLLARLETLQAAYDSGTLTVRDADGKSVTYRSLADMRRAIDSLRKRTGGTRRPRVVLAQQRRGD